MGKNKDLRKKRAEYLRAIEKHERKLEELLRRSNPDPVLVRKWRNDIRILWAEVERVDRKLQKR